MTAAKPVLIIVSGPPASGKTTLSRRLAADLRLPLVQRDSLKERLFDTLGWRDRALSQRLGGASYELLYYTLDLLLQTGQPCIVESNFSRVAASHKLTTLLEYYGYTAIQILCFAAPDVLLERFTARHAAGERHPGHVDDLALPEFTAQIQQRWEPLDVAGPLIELDTSTTFDYKKLMVQITAILVGSEEEH